MDALATDLYQFTMLDAYLAEGLEAPATFELYVRRLPAARPVLVAAGLEVALQWLQALHFDEAEIEWLGRTAGLHARTLRWLREFRFTGDVDAMPEGTPFYAEEPILRLTAPLPQAQLVESRLLNLMHLSTLVASKAARVVTAAGGRRLVDFGMRRAHGAEAAVLGARAAWLAGFDGTATVEAGRRFGVPVYGTMAHSYVQAHEEEAAAFEAFVRARPVRPTLLVDTYDTQRGVARAAALARRLAASGLQVQAVRLDSGDLLTLAQAARRTLDEAGLGQIEIFASGDLDEHRVAALVAAGAPVDGFGVGTALTTSSDVPALDMVYKLQAYAGVPRRKRSPGKATWPGVRQVWREAFADGQLRRDLVCTADEAAPRPEAEPRTHWEALLQPCLRQGHLVRPHPPLPAVRARHAQMLHTLPPRLRALAPVQPPYPVDVSTALRALAAQDTEGSSCEVSASRAPAATISASARAPSPGWVSTGATASPSSTTS
jgi:nicotinate phosphoribosyltransferase